MNRKKIIKRSEIQTGIAKPIWLSRQISLSALALSERPSFETLRTLQRLKIVPTAFQPKSALLWRAASYSRLTKELSTIIIKNILTLLELVL